MGTYYETWPPTPTPVDPLRQAIADGDVTRVRTLIEAGADIHYRIGINYDALLDAVFGSASGKVLLELISLLIQQGVELSAVTAYGQSALKDLSMAGHFDAVRLLLDAGADRTQLAWTPLIEAVALGSLDDVQAVLAEKPDLEARDGWSRTAWLVALLIGDSEKAFLLLEHGADPRARGNCGAPPVFYAIHGHHPEMLRRLLRGGADLHATDQFGSTALMEAVEREDLDCVEILLQAGADVSIDVYGTALSNSTSREISLRLLKHGADPADADQRVLLGLNATIEEALVTVTPEEFRRAHTRRFGRKNPERMDEPFWIAMIRCAATGYAAREWFALEVPQAAYPIWSAQRFGQSLTFLPDGRAVQIAGEHEDYYDPDFCIFNDVFVHHLDGSISIYGYPCDVFPPTDFHTATLVGDSIYVIGSLGYQGARGHRHTPVYRLDTRNWRITRMRTDGDPPGWIYKHRAVAISPHEIRVWSGTIAVVKGKQETNERNPATYVLDLKQLRWRKETA